MILDASVTHAASPVEAIDRTRNVLLANEFAFRHHKTTELARRTLRANAFPDDRVPNWA